MPEDVEACKMSIMEDNPEMDESMAYAICNDMENKGQLSPSGVIEKELSISEKFLQETPCWDGYTMVGTKVENGEIVPNCVPDDEVENYEGEMKAMSKIRQHASRTLQADEIKRVENAPGDPTGSVRYKNVALLAPGEWTDSTSRTTYYYSPEGIRASVDNWADDNLHLNHDGDQTILADIGYIDTETARTDTEGKLVADIVFHGRTDQSRNAEELMQLAMETDGARGIGGPSVEIVDTTDEWNEERGVFETTEMMFSGAGLVTRPASESVAFSEQLTRAAAEAEDGKERVLMRKSMGEEEKESAMSDIREMNSRIGKIVKALQSPAEHEEFDELLDTYMGAVEDAGSDSVAQMVDWVQENTDGDTQAFAQMMIDAFTAEEETTPEESTVDELAEWCQQSLDDALEEDEMGDYEMEGDDYEGDEEDEEDEMDMAKLQGRVEELEKRLSEIDETVDSHSSDLSQLDEETDDLRLLASNIDNVMESLETVQRELKEVREQEAESRRALTQAESVEELQIPFRGNGR